MDLSEKVCNEVKRRDKFSMDSIGRQTVRTVDYAAANLGDGSGQFYCKETKHVTCCSGESLFELKTWIPKVRNRGLSGDTNDLNLIKSMDVPGVQINPSGYPGHHPAENRTLIEKRHDHANQFRNVSGNPKIITLPNHTYPSNPHRIINASP